MRIIETVVAVNDARKRAMARKVIAACGGSVRGKTIAHAGPRPSSPTPTTCATRRPSPSITALQDAGAIVRAYDPQGMAHAKTMLPNVEFAESAYECVNGADALVIVTEWDEFRALDLDRVKQVRA